MAIRSFWDWATDASAWQVRNNEKFAAVTPAKRRNSIVETLLDNPLTFGNNEIRVWLEAEYGDDRIYDGVDEYVEAHFPSRLICGLIPTNDAVELAPGQPFIFLQGHAGRCWRAEFLRFPTVQPFVDLPNGRFLHMVPYSDYKGLVLGDRRHLRTAGQRALKKTGNADWIGGIADFATQFLRRRVRGIRAST